MMNTNNTCIVKNRSASHVIYRIPELNIRREFMPGETKKLSMEELTQLSYQPGGLSLMANFLQIQTAGVTQELGIHTEPEYNMSEQQIVDLIRAGSLDEFLDCLDFAPIGVIDLLKQFAVSVPLNDYDKRVALKQKTGFDVDAALRHIEEEKAEEKPSDAAAPAGRRVQAQPTETPATPGRRTSGSGYKVISKIETPAENAE
jgi:hypothetical protein